MLFCSTENGPEHCNKIMNYIYYYLFNYRSHKFILIVSYNNIIKLHFRKDQDTYI